MPDYPPPVDRLLSYRPTEFGEDWPDYPSEFGLGPEHVPDLIRMAGDPALYEDDEEDRDELAFYGTIHARRALGQLRAEGAVRPLLEAMNRFHDYDDYWFEELPRVMAMIGPAAIPALAEALTDERLDETTRIGVSSCLTAIGSAHPEARAECVEALTRQLASKKGGEGHWSANGFIVSALVDLKAVESAPLIEEAFAAAVVDESIAGDWPYTRYRLGLGPKPPPRRYQPFGLGPGFVGPERARRPDLKKLARKRKSEKQARKQGRKRR